MEEREIMTLTEQEIYDSVKNAALDFLYKTRNIVSRPALYSYWLNEIELFVKENINVVVTGLIGDDMKTHFRYQHSYWTQYKDILLEIDGITREKTVDVYNGGPRIKSNQIANRYVRATKISWDIDKYPSHGLMLKFYISFTDDVD